MDAFLLDPRGAGLLLRTDGGPRLARLEHLDRDVPDADRGRSGLLVFRVAAES